MKVLISFILVLGLLLGPSVALAEHKSAVGDKVIDSSDPGITDGHSEGCEYVHYHGELEGVADPAPRGCGHGQVTTIAHDDGDGETLPTPAPVKKKSLWTRFWDKVADIFGKDTSDTAQNVVDVAAEANGLPSPGTIHDTVEIVEEATPSIMENVDNIKEYRGSVEPEDDTLGIYSKPDAGLKEGSLSQRFFRWFNNLIGK